MASNGPRQNNGAQRKEDQVSVVTLLLSRVLTRNSVLQATLDSKCGHSKGDDSGPRVHGFKTQALTRINCVIASQGLRFLICEMGIKIAPVLQSHSKDG